MDEYSVKMVSGEKIKKPPISNGDHYDRGRMG